MDTLAPSPAAAAQKNATKYSYSICCSHCQNNNLKSVSFIGDVIPMNAQCIFWPIFVWFRIKLKIELFKKPIDIF
jgi:hypothetical protein